MHCSYDESRLRRHAEGFSAEKEERDFRALGEVTRSAVILVAAIFLAAVLVLFCQGCQDPVWASPGDFLSVARAQIGRGETGGDNHGPAVRAYLNGREGLPWCAGFVSYCLRESGHKTGYTLCARDYLKKGVVVRNPLPGDVVVFWRGNPHASTGHVEIVERVTSGEIVTIAGNTGGYPSRVKRITYRRGSIPRLLGFVRLAG